MQHNIRRNKRIFDYLIQQKVRIKWNIPLDVVFTDFVFENLSVSDSKELVGNIQQPIREEILDNEAVLTETLKLIGLMELSTNEEELMALLTRRKEIKYGRPLTDFDKILKAIMTVPNPKEKKA